MNVVVILTLFLLQAISTLGQERCCAAEKHEVSGEFIGSLRRKDRLDSLTESDRFAVDYVNQIRGAEGHVDYLNGTNIRIRTVEKFREKALWLIDQNGCAKYALNETLHRCVPENARFIRSSYAGDRQLMVDLWHIDRNDGGKRGLEVLAFTHGNCVPYSSSFEGERISVYDEVRENVSFTGVYFDFHEGIQDPDRFFSLPDICPR